MKDDFTSYGASRAFENLKVGDLVEATYDHPGPGQQYTIRGKAWAESPGLGDDDVLRIGTRVLRWSDGAPGVGLTNLDLLAPAKVPFYTNQPADRQPRIGDVAATVEPDDTFSPYVFVGDGWIATQGAALFNRQRWIAVFDHGVLALVDPAELEES